MNARKITKLLLNVLVIVGAFYSGLRYDQVMRHREEILIFANFYGDQVIEVNELLNSIDAKDKVSELLKDYNESAIVNAGCSAWYEYLVYFDQDDYLTFSDGMKVAFKSLGEASPNVWKCLNNLKESELINL